ncbi:hypothetical protein CFP56_025325 [Quercus suber]|uniref:Uncharacterized protein n=1 Tax=Quercus suber TaxID=58331 RepID=A0AAW0K4E9_QUESU
MEIISVYSVSSSAQYGNTIPKCEEIEDAFIYFGPTVSEVLFKPSPRHIRYTTFHASLALTAEWFDPV